MQGDGESEMPSESNRTVDAFIHGNLESNSITSGQGAAMIWDIPNCGELIETIVGEARPIVDRLGAIFR
jgi:hypothetical protein